MTVVKLKALRSRQTGTFGGGNYRCSEAVGNIHDCRIYVLYVSYPEIKGSRTENKFRGYGVGQRYYAGISVHCRKTRTAYAVESYSQSTFFLGQLYHFFALA